MKKLSLAIINVALIVGWMGIAGCDPRTSTPLNSPVTAMKAVSAASATASAAAEPAYKMAFGIIDLQPDPKKPAEDLAEVASDIGFYMMEAKDALNNSQSGVTFVVVEDGNYRKIPVQVNGKLLKHIDGKALMKKGECCGYVVVQNGKEPAFIPVEPSVTAKRMREYFGIRDVSESGKRHNTGQQNDKHP